MFQDRVCTNIADIVRLLGKQPIDVLRQCTGRDQRLALSNPRIQGKPTLWKNDSESNGVLRSNGGKTFNSRKRRLKSSELTGGRPSQTAWQSFKGVKKVRLSPEAPDATVIFFNELIEYIEACLLIKALICQHGNDFVLHFR